MTWAPPASDGGSAITGYRVARDGTDTHGTGAWSTTVPATTGTFTFSSLKPGTAYHLTVQAVNTTGTGPAATTTATTATTAPTAPTGLTHTQTSSSATMTWAPPASDGGSAITGYRVARDGTDTHGTGAWSTTVPATTGTFTFSSLKPGTAYHLTVQAVNATGTGPAATTTATTATG